MMGRLLRPQFHPRNVALGMEADKAVFPNQSHTSNASGVVRELSARSEAGLKKWVSVIELGRRLRRDG